jgi:xylitol oxidase
LGLNKRIEAALTPFAPRPHWGKVNSLSAQAISKAHPRIHDAKALFARLDPEGMFANAYLKRVGLR